jgi:hypothetical protein
VCYAVRQRGDAPRREEGDMKTITWGEACLLLNDRIGERVAVAIRATGETTVAQYRGVLDHITPDQQFAEVVEAMGEIEHDPDSEELDFRPNREGFDRDLAVYRVGDDAMFDLSDLDYLDMHGGCIEHTSCSLIIPLDDAAVMEVMFLEEAV